MKKLTKLQLMTTDELLERAKELLSEATPGPWRVGSIGGQCTLGHSPHGQGQCDYRVVLRDDPQSVSRVVEKGIEWSEQLADEALIAGQYDYEMGGIVRESDAALIAAAPELITALIAEVERLSGGLERARELRSEFDRQAKEAESTKGSIAVGVVGTAQVAIILTASRRYAADEILKGFDPLPDPPEPQGE